MSGYEIAHLDELERLPVDDEGLTWRPVRRRFGIEAFGVNAYTAEHAGQRVVEEHTEAQNEHQELYFVASGHATFTLDGEEVDAPSGTFVFVEPSVRRGAVARDGGTTVLALGGKPGEAFTPSAWEWTFVAAAYQRLGRLDDARAVMNEGIERSPDAWQGHYNLACIEAQAGDRDAALAALERAAELDPATVARYARDDSDFGSIRDDLRFSAIAGEASSGGAPT